MLGPFLTPNDGRLHCSGQLQVVLPQEGRPAGHSCPWIQHLPPH
jgi:hypothetical protein